MTRKNISRREFVIDGTKRVLGAGVAVALLSSCDSDDDSSNNNPTNPNPDAITLDTTLAENQALASAGGAIYLDVAGESMPVIVHRISDTQVVAFSSTCTHSGCKVALPQNGKVVCPCHNSEFDDSGNLLKGPATRDLDKFTASIEGTVITITM